VGRQNCPRIGLAWRGNPGHVNDLNRSIPLDVLLDALPSTGVEYVSLQRDLLPKEVQTLRDNPQLKFFGEEILDFSDTAAICDLVDVVLSVDTSAAHLSAALGRTTWVLLPFHPDWR
jgi:hypothetical protein